MQLQFLNQIMSKNEIKKQRKNEGEINDGKMNERSEQNKKKIQKQKQTFILKQIARKKKYPFK